MSHDSDPPIPQPGHSGNPEPANAQPERLWTPWRMRYVAGAAREDGCIFCNRCADKDDVRTLILHRSTHAFVIMNLFPYNTGHVMLVPYAHIASLEEADEATTADLADLRRPVLAALRRSLTPAGFNLGLNIGDVAGAGVSEHLHEHVVPRWQGDANFMPILASTMVMPELIPTTYAKVRAELQRATHPLEPVVNVVIANDRQSVLVDASKCLPRVPVGEAEAVWRAAQHDAQRRGAREVELLAWAGDARAGEGPIALLHSASLTQLAPNARAPVTAAIMDLDEPDRRLVQTALTRINASR